MAAADIKTIDDLLKMGPGLDTAQHTLVRHVVVSVGEKHWPWDREHLHEVKARDAEDGPEIVIDSCARGSRLDNLRLLAWWCEEGRCADVWCDLCEPYRIACGGTGPMDHTTGFISTIWLAAPRTPNERAHIYQGWVCASSMQALVVEIRRNHNHPADLFVRLEAQRRFVNDPDQARTKLILVVTGVAPAPPSAAVAKYNALLQALEPGGWAVATSRPT